MQKISFKNIMDSNYIKLIGRNYYDDDLDAVMMSQSASGFTIKFKGTSLTLDLVTTNSEIDSKRPFIAIIIDGNYNNPRVVSLNKPLYKNFIIVSGLDDVDHEITVIKRNEALESFFGLKSVSTDGFFIEKVIKPRYIEILGDSTVAGYGNEVPNGVLKASDNTNIMKTFTYIAAQKFDADYSIICASGWGVVGSVWTNPQTVNLCEIYKRRYYGTLDVNTLTHKYSEKIYDFSNNRQSDVIVLSIGANDLTYVDAGYQISEEEGLKRIEVFNEEYLKLLEFINELHPNAEIFMVSWQEIPMYYLVKKAFDAANMSNTHIVTVTGDMKSAKHHPSAQCHIEISDILINEISKIMGWEI